MPTSLDPKRSIRPYRKVDMGSELEDHNDRLKKLERLEGQVRAFQGLALALIGTVVGLGYQDCRATDAKEIESAKIEQQVQAHERRLESADPKALEKALEAAQQTVKEHGERLITIERKLYIKNRK